MSADAHHAAQLVKTLNNGVEGFNSAAEKLSPRIEVADKFRGFSAERAEFSSELTDIAAQYGDDMPDGGSLAGSIHRGWMAFKDLVTGSSDESVIEAAKTGEDHAVEQYEEAINDPEVSPEFKIVLQRQLNSVVAARAYVSGLSA
jgi:uncharacterized protein (TIGR02284 family)